MDSYDKEHSEPGMITGRFMDLKRRGARAEYAFDPAADLKGRPPIFYVPDKLVTTIENANIVHRLLEEWHGKCGEPEPLLDHDRSLVVFTVAGDSLHIATAIKQAAAKRYDVPENLPVGPLHILTPAPQPRIGPGDDPVPASKRNMGPRGPEVKPLAPIAVIDTGVWESPANGLVATSPESPAAIEQVDVSPADGFVDYYGTGHGGFIAGVIENNAPGAKVIAHNAFGPQGLTEATVINEVDKALQQNELIVLNLSLGSYEKDDAGCDRVELVALRNAMRRWSRDFPRALIVAAAGNDSMSHPFFPAGFAGEEEFADMVVSVGALSRPAEGMGVHSSAASFSNYGAWVTAWAPGQKIVSEYPDDLKFAYVDASGSRTGSAPFADGLAFWSGTSFAAPFVAAEIIREMRDGESPRDTWKRIRGASPFVIFWPGW